MTLTVWVGWLSSRHAGLARKTRELAALGERQRAGAAQVGRLERLRRDVAALEQRHPYLARRRVLPPQHLADRLRRLASIADLAALELVRVQLASGGTDAVSAGRAVRLEAIGSYTAITRFADEAARQGEEVKELEVSVADESVEPPDLSVTCLVRRLDVLAGTPTERPRHE